MALSLERCHRFAYQIGLASCLGKPQAIKASQDQSYDRDWIKINQYSPVEGFESHGSYGWHLGVGFLTLPNSPNASFQDNSDNLPNEMNQVEQTKIPRLFLTHGTRLPLDFGLSLAHSRSNLGAQIGGHLQWTFFEGFQKPAIALRISRIESLGIKGIDKLQTDSCILGISYGFWRYFNFGIGIGQQLTKFKTKAEQSEELFGIRGDIGIDSIESQSIFCANFKIDLLSPFLKLGFERIFSYTSERVSLVKISYML